MEYTVCSFPPTHPGKPTAVLPPPLHTPARAVRRAYMKAPRQRYVVVGGLWLYAFLTELCFDSLQTRRHGYDVIWSEPPNARLCPNPT